MDPFAQGGGLGECAARYLRWERREIQQSASGVYGAFGARSEEPVEIRVGEVAENTTRGSVAPHQRRRVRNGDSVSVSGAIKEVLKARRY